MGLWWVDRGRAKPRSEWQCILVFVHMGEYVYACVFVCVFVQHNRCRVKLCSNKSNVYQLTKNINKGREMQHIQHSHSRCTSDVLAVTKGAVTRAAGPKFEPMTRRRSLPAVVRLTNQGP